MECGDDVDWTLKTHFILLRRTMREQPYAAQGLSGVSSTIANMANTHFP
jgi:hypothetical protein